MEHAHKLGELPPRTRRIPLSSRAMMMLHGTTSAYAENTTWLPASESPKWNYLRVRGEYLSSLFRFGGNQELPPRTRRIRMQNATHADLAGTTSAYAENTTPASSSIAQHQNYLRVRGEYARASPTAVTGSELPPRTRRIRLTTCGYRPPGGTTSAYAENTLNELGLL